MKRSPQEIIKILRSIEDLRLDKNGELEVKFNPTSTTYPDGWEPNCGYVNGSFTEQLLLLIEDSLKGNLSDENVEVIG